MKEEHKNLTPIEKALLTWYKPDNSKYKDPIHPTLKLAGEIGELLDLYAKHLFKPGFDWMDCKYWGNCDYCQDKCTPKALDELGDIWYYLRIVAWQNDVYLSINQWSKEYTDIQNLAIIKEMYNEANQFLQNKHDTRAIEEIYFLLLDLIDNLNYTIDQLTELNYIKLNSEDTNHGWKDAV